MTPLRQRMLEDLRIRNYSSSTVRAYVRCVADFARHFNKPPDKLGAEEIRHYQLFLLNEKRVKLSSYIQARMVKKPVLIENKGELESPHSGVNRTLRIGLLVS
jgi:hypothetical protein